PAAGGGPAAVEAVHQGAFAGATRPEQADEFAWLDGEVDVVEQLAGFALGQADDLFEVAGLQAEALAAVERVDRAAGDAEEERTDAHTLIFLDGDRFDDPLAADEDAVDTVEVAQANALRQPFQQGVTAGNRGVRQ